MIRVGLADDHEIVRNGIKMILENDPEIEVIWETADGKVTLEKMDEDQPDVLVADIRMPMLTGLEVVKELRSRQSNAKVIILTMYDDSEYIVKSLQYGADGYLLKDTSREEFTKAVKMVNDNQKYFSGDISTTLVNSLMNNPKLDQSIGEKSETGTNQSDYQLTKREREILALIYEGVSNKDIAEKLNKSIRTIETHRFNIMKKLEVSNITELLKKVEREQLL